MKYFSSKRKQIYHTYDTRPSYHSSTSSSNNYMRFSQSDKKFGQNFPSHEKADSCIKFNNGWVFEGQHFNGKFHGWGTMISSEGKVVYKGNFQNGFFQKIGKIYFHPMFSYLFSEQEITQWIQKSINFPNQQQKSLNQIQEINPFRIKKKKKYSECEEKENLKVEWQKYEGDFNSGNANGFGTLKVKVYYVEDKQQQQKSFKIVGKFKDGHIFAGIIK